MKGTFLLAGLIVFSLSGCGQTQHKVIPQPITAPPLEHTVNTKVIGTIQDVKAGANGHNRWYNITLEKVEKVDEVEKKYEVIQSGTSQGPGEVLSNVLSPGTVLYEIPGIDPTQALAVQWKGQYVKATRINK